MTSSVVDKNPIMESIADWADYKSAEIKAAYDQKGGWEGWVQVELARHLQQYFGHEGVAEVTREEYVYNGTDQRSDLLITTTKTNGDAFTNMFELKCESSGNSGKFRTEVKADCAKINNGVWNAKYNPCKAWIVAFGVSKTVGDFVVGGANLKEYHRKIQAGGTQITLWWGTRS
ncbi:uncharacterized protein C8R40DRAFT_590845 [Lentinula edodes]|uniref:uncharacterized protein n=1 Tax=Lentinula edodes TaxID=5353 RepID=UPI001E8DD9E2|nr:uncharacterized protein C8R40DRAFT_590845 [Lentinula edodes]KAH7879303.1 hypothetical protein C8R40DRAFT_590845 [Lentinula edodes]KAJ3915087.1 hypothetical protein F5877DRAFT_70164 [Lentinula edodes]